MVQVQQRVLIALCLLAAPHLDARKFFDDDPIWREPRPMSVEKANKRKINEYYDFFQNTLFQPNRETMRPGRIPPAQAVNTLGEVPDSAWFQNRHGSRPMTLRELVRGPGDSNAPAADAPWAVVSAKNEGITPGLLIEDSRHHRYLIKFDPISNPEIASAADVIGSKFFYDLGYSVPENYIVRFDRRQLVVGGKARIRDSHGRDTRMTERDIDMVLNKVLRDREGRYRGMASLYISGEPIGPFRYYGVRRDDPNDVVPHENRRDLRGMYVFSAWLNHTDTKSINSLDSVVEEDGVRFVKHYLIDFGAILGSDSFEAKSPRAGNVYLFDFKPAAIEFLTLGLYVPRWQRAQYPDIPEVGRLEYEVFDPERWKNNYPNPAFQRRLPGDTFWAAKKVMAFTDEQIRAIVQTGEYSDPRAADWVTRCLIARRDKIGRAFFDDVLPLDHFAVKHGRLEFEDLAAKYNFAPPVSYTVQWSRFDNDTEQKAPLPGRGGFEIPAELSKAAPGAYFAADIQGQDARKTVTVYLRKTGGDFRIVGVDRRW